MRSWIELLAAVGVCGTVALASSASFGQGVYVEGAPYGVGGPTYDTYAGGYYYGSWPVWQYHGGPKSTSTTDMYWIPSYDVYWFEGPNYGRRVGPR